MNSKYFVDVASLRTQGMSTADIATASGAPHWWVARRLRKLGIQYRPGRVIRRADEALALYDAGLTATQIGERLGMAHHSVMRRLRAQGISPTRADGVRRRYHQNPSVPHSFTFTTLTPDTAWMLGLLFGDGTMDKRGRVVSIATAELDVPGKLSAIVGRPLPVNRPNGQKCAMVNICNTRVWRELNQCWGLMPNKSRTMMFPRVPPDVMPHFVRGLLDSDGCWWLRKDRRLPRLHFTYVSASPRFVAALRDVLVDTLGVSETIVPREMQLGIKVIKYSHHDAVAIGRWLYGDGCSVANRCDRKYATWTSASELPVRKRPVLNGGASRSDSGT